MYVQHVQHAQWLVCVWRAGPSIVLFLKSISPSRNAFLEWVERIIPTPKTTQPPSPPQSNKKPTHKTIDKNKQQQNKQTR